MYLLARRCKNHITLLTERLSSKRAIWSINISPHWGEVNGLCCFKLECTNQILPSSLSRRTLTNPVGQPGTALQIPKG